MQFFTYNICRIPSFTIPSVGTAVEEYLFSYIKEVQNTPPPMEEDLVTSTRIKDLFIFK